MQIMYNDIYDSTRGNCDIIILTRIISGMKQKKLIFMRYKVKIRSNQKYSNYLNYIKYINVKRICLWKYFVSPEQTILNKILKNYT